MTKPATMSLLVGRNLQVLLLEEFGIYLLLMSILSKLEYIYLLESWSWTSSYKHIFRMILLLLHYNSGRVLAFSTIPFHFRRSWICSAHFISFIFLRSFLTSSSHRDLGLPAGLLVGGFHLYIFPTIFVSGILFMFPNQLNLWALI